MLSIQDSNCKRFEIPIRAEASTTPTDFPPSWDGGTNYQAGSTTSVPNLLQRRDMKDAKDALEKHIDTTMMVCQQEVKIFNKGIVKGSPFDGDKPRHIELGLQILLQGGKIKDAKFASKKHINGIDRNFRSKPSKVVNYNTKAKLELPPRGYKFASRDLKSVSLLGKGFSGIVYETIWKKKLRCARKDFVRVPSAIFEREIEKFVRLKDHSNVVQTFGWAVAKICCSLVLELMDCSLRSLTERRKLLRRVTSSEPHVDSTSTSDSGCSNSPEITLIPQQEIEIKMDDLASSPMSASSCKAQSSSNSPFSMLEVIEIITAIARGMKYLHDNKVAHGDLKPGNILVTLKKRAGSSTSFDDSLAFTTVKVADFGVIESKSTSRCMTSVSVETRKLDKTRRKAPELFDIDHGLKVADFGVIESKSMSRCMTSVSVETQELDKTRRKAPELFDIDHGLKQDFDALAMGDIYSFGMTASEILSGEEPYSDYQNSGVKTLQELVLKGTRPELPDRCEQLNELIRRCWDCELTKRPKFGSILEELKKIQAALSVEEKSRRAMWPTSHVLESSHKGFLAILEDCKFSNAGNAAIPAC